MKKEAIREVSECRKKVALGKGWTRPLGRLSPGGVPGPRGTEVQLEGPWAHAPCAPFGRHTSALGSRDVSPAGADRERSSPNRCLQRCNVWGLHLAKACGG